jgi:transcriptional regulator with XRE-family HTH domain
MGNMPARTPPIGTAVTAKLAAIGQQIRAHRKAMRVSATVAAEAAGMSRVTLHRIERGEPSVAMGAYLSAMSAMGLDVKLFDPAVRTERKEDAVRQLPAAIRLADYPQLRRLAWQLKGVKQLDPVQALDLYERNWRHVDQKAMTSRERELVALLATALGRGRLLV